MGGKYKPKEKPRKKEINGKTDSKQRLNRKKHSEVMYSFHSTDKATSTDGHNLTKVSAMVKTNILLNSVII